MDNEIVEMLEQLRVDMLGPKRNQGYWRLKVMEIKNAAESLSQATSEVKTPQEVIEACGAVPNEPLTIESLLKAKGGEICFELHGRQARLWGVSGDECGEGYRVFFATKNPTTGDWTDVPYQTPAAVTNAIITATLDVAIAACNAVCEEESVAQVSGVSSEKVGTWADDREKRWACNCGTIRPSDIESCPGCHYKRPDLGSGGSQQPSEPAVSLSERIAEGSGESLDAKVVTGVLSDLVRWCERLDKHLSRLEAAHSEATKSAELAEDAADEELPGPHTAPDPGEGYRLLRHEEMLQVGDESFNFDNNWVLIHPHNKGLTVGEFDIVRPCRRKLEPQASTAPKVWEGGVGLYDFLVDKGWRKRIEIDLGYDEAHELGDKYFAVKVTPETRKLLGVDK